MPNAKHRHVFLKEEPAVQVEDKADSSSSWSSVDEGAPHLDSTPSKAQK